MSLTDSTLSADHNYVLAHETGHMLDFSERTAQELTYQRDHIKTRYKVRRLASRGAIIGALAGAGISEITNLPSIETTPAGILALGGLGFVIGASTVSKDIDRENQYMESRENFAENFVNDERTATLFGRIIEIELKKSL
jgi:hypothetical protein